jgi:hypothetical protein
MGPQSWRDVNMLRVRVSAHKQRGEKHGASIVRLSTRQPEGFYSKFNRYLQCTLLVKVQCKKKGGDSKGVTTRVKGNQHLIKSNMRGAIAFRSLRLCYRSHAGPFQAYTPCSPYISWEVSM